MMCARSYRLVVILSAITGAWSVPVRADPPSANLIAEFNQATADFEQAQQIQAEEPDRARRLFRSAAQRFESLIAAGVVNGRLEFNLGNCHLQAGGAGEAILHYRRAEKLMPRDARLADNLAEARSRVLTSIRPAPGSALLRSVFFWHHDTSLGERCRAALLLYVILWVILALRVFLPLHALSVAAVICAGLTLTLAGSIAFERWSENHTPAGVVTEMDVVVYKGPGTGYQRRFEQPLQSGVEFSVSDRRGEWWEIVLADGSGGWVRSTQAELVNPRGTTQYLGAS